MKSGMPLESVFSWETVKWSHLTFRAFPWMLTKCSLSGMGPLMLRISWQLEGKRPWRHNRGWNKQVFTGALLKGNRLLIQICTHAHAHISSVKSSVTNHFIESKKTKSHSLFDVQWQCREVNTLISKSLLINILLKVKSPSWACHVESYLPYCNYTCFHLAFI